MKWWQVGLAWFDRWWWEVVLVAGEVHVACVAIGGWVYGWDFVVEVYTQAWKLCTGTLPLSCLLKACV